MLKIKQIHSVLLYFIIPALATGPFLSDLIVSITGLLFIIITFLEKNFKYYKSKFFIFFILFNFYLIINSLLSNNSLLSFESTLFYFRFTFFVLSIWYALENNSKFINIFSRVFIFTFFLVLVDAYIQYFFDYNILGYEYNSNRLSGIFGDEMVLGSYISRLLPLLFALMIATNFKASLYLGILLLVMSDVVIYLSGERVAFFNLLLSTFIIIMLVGRWKAVRSVAVLFSLIFIALISVTNQSVTDRMIFDTLNQLNQKTATQEAQNYKFRFFSIEHENGYFISLRMFKDNKLFGIGPKNFREECKREKYFIDYGCHTHPHNFYLQLLSETGIIGFIPFFFIFFFLSYKMVEHFLKKLFMKKIILNDYQVCIFACLYVTLFPIVPSGNIFNNWLSIIYYLPIGFLYYNFKNYDNH